MEQAILSAETRVAELEATLSDPAVFKDRGVEVPAMVAALDEARATVEGLFDRWHALEELSRAG